MISHQFTGLALAVSVTLAACGGGGSAEDTSAPAPLNSGCHATVTVQLVGDSTADQNFTGTTVYDSAGRNALQVAMDARFGAGRVLFVNSAIPGTDTRSAPAPAGDAVLVNYGINDAGHHLPIDTYKANLRAIAKGRPTLFQTPNPIYGVDDADLPGPYAQAMREVADELDAPVAEVYDYVLAIPDWHAALRDLVHPKVETYLAEDRDVIAPALGQMLAPMLCRQ